MTTPIMNRKDRRKAAKSKARQNRTAKIGAIGLSAMLLAGVASSAHASIDTPTIEKDSKGQTLSEWDLDAMGLTSAERAKWAKQEEMTKGKMSGSVKMNISQKSIDELAAIGLKVDTNASNAAANKLIKEAKNSTDFGQFGKAQLQLKIEVADSAKLKAHAASLGFKDFDLMPILDPEDGASNVNHNRLSLAVYRDDYSNLIAQPNISTAEVFKPLMAKKGDVLPVTGGMIGLYPDVSKAPKEIKDFVAKYNPSFNALTGTYGIATLAPVSSTSSGGYIDDGEKASNVSNTVFRDYYADGDSPERLGQLVKSGNGHNGPVSNCSVSKCSVWVTPLMQGNDAAESGKVMAALDTIRIDVETTVSAGKLSDLSTIGNPMIAANGAKLWNELELLQAPRFGAWENAAGLADDVARIKNGLSKASLKNVSRNGDGRIEFDIATAGSASFTTHGFVVKSGSVGEVKVSSTDGKLELTDEKGLALKVGSQLRFADFTVKVLSISGAEVSLQITDKKGAITDADAGFGFVNVGLSLNMIWGGTGEAEPNYLVPVFTPGKAPATPKPTAILDVKTGKFGQPVTIDVLKNDSASKGFTVQKDTLRLIDPVSKKKVRTYSFKGQGTYVATDKGNVEFTPVKGFAGKATKLGYAWNETDGKLVQSASSTVQAIITPEEKPEIPEEKPKDEKPEISIIPKDPSEKPKDIPKDPEKKTTDDFGDDDGDDGDHGDDSEKGDDGDDMGEEILDAGAAMLTPYLAGGFAGLFAFIGGVIAAAANRLKNRKN